MRSIRIYTTQTLASGIQFNLEPQASIHLLRVLRLPLGAQLELFNGDGSAWQASITAAGKKQAEVMVGEQLVSKASATLVSEIAVAVSKGDKMDLIVQKCTELGVSRISPLISQRTDVRLDKDRWQKKLEHWQQVMISACEQCGRNDLVDIQAVSTLDDWLAHCSAANKLIFHPWQAGSMQAVAAATSLAMCFGPEGGFSDDEIATAARHGFQPIRLGPRVLRAETAPLAALAIAQSQWGDFLV